jgi:NADH-quinone oxidoreductase subunit E
MVKKSSSGTATIEPLKSIDSLTQKKQSKSKDNTLLRGLDLLSEYYASGLGDHVLRSELNSLLVEAVKRYPGEKEKAILKLSQELHTVNKIIDKYQGDKEALIQILLDINNQEHWLPHESLRWVSARLDVPLSQIYHIGSFYKVFSLVPQGRHIIQVCLGTACQVRGAPRLLDKVLESLKLQTPGTDKENKFTVTTVNCLGCCALGPVMTIDQDHYSDPTREQISNIFEKYN